MHQKAGGPQRRWTTHVPSTRCGIVPHHGAPCGCGTTSVPRQLLVSAQSHCFSARCPHARRSHVPPPRVHRRRASVSTRISRVIRPRRVSTLGRLVLVSQVAVPPHVFPVAHVSRPCLAWDPTPVGIGVAGGLSQSHHTAGCLARRRAHPPLRCCASSFAWAIFHAANGATKLRRRRF